MGSLPDLAIGALIALCGVIVAQLVAVIQSRLDRKHQKQILLRTKYEEMASHFLDSMKLPADLLMCASHEETLAVTHQSSANRAHMLALVYFPLLRQATERYIESYSALCLTAISLYDPQDKKLLGTQVFNRSEYVAARNNHIAARDFLQNQIEAHASEYVRA